MITGGGQHQPCLRGRLCAMPLQDTAAGLELDRLPVTAVIDRRVDRRTEARRRVARAVPLEAAGCAVFGLALIIGCESEGGTDSHRPRAPAAAGVRRSILARSPPILIFSPPIP